MSWKKSDWYSEPPPTLEEKVPTLLEQFLEGTNNLQNANMVKLLPKPNKTIDLIKFKKIVNNYNAFYSQQLQFSLRIAKIWFTYT